MSLNSTAISIIFADDCRYIVEICCHFQTRIEELHRNMFLTLSFKIIDKANSKFNLKIKEALHINWRKPNLNAQ